MLFRTRAFFFFSVLRVQRTIPSSSSSSSAVAEDGEKVHVHGAWELGKRECLFFKLDVESAARRREKESEASAEKKMKSDRVSKLSKRAHKFKRFHSFLSARGSSS